MHENIRPLCGLVASFLVVFLDTFIIGIVVRMVGHMCGLRMCI